MIKCDVCSGEQVIRLRKRQPVSIEFDPSKHVEMEVGYKTFPCPNCTDYAPMTRLYVVQELYENEVPDAAVTHITENLARKLGQGALDRGMVKVDHNKGLGYAGARPWDRHTIVASIGIVAPKDIASFEERVREQQFTRADEVVAMAEAEIMNWGSYGAPGADKPIKKSDAIRFLRDCLNRMKARPHEQRRRNP